MQSKYHSLIESITNIAIGYLVALASQLLIFPFYGIAISLTDNLLIGAWFTVISIVRSYTIRLWFNKKTAAEVIINEEDLPCYLRRQAD